MPAVPSRARAIAENLRRVREAKGVSIRALAAAANVSTQTVVNIEKGLGCNVSTLESLSEALSVPFEDLVAMPVSTASGEALLERFRRSEWHALAEVTAEEEDWLRSHAVEYLGEEEPPDKAVWLLLLARRER